MKRTTSASILDLLAPQSTLEFAHNLMEKQGEEQGRLQIKFPPTSGLGAYNKNEALILEKLDCFSYISKFVS